MENLELSRIPQNLTYDYTAFERAFDTAGDKTGKLIKDIIIFLSNNKMKNLFGETSFTMQDFCSQMGYTRTHLQKRLSSEKIDEIFGKNIPVLETPLNSGTVHVHKIETVFEAALWRAMKENITFSRIRDGKTVYQSIQLIESLMIDYKKETSKQTRRIYTIKLSNSIIDLLFNKYLLIEMQDYRRLPTGEGYRQFYIYLSRMIALIKYNIKEKQPPYYLLSVDELAKIFGISIERNDLRKTKVKNYLQAIQRIVEITKFKFEFVKNNERYAYHVLFTIPEDILEYFDEKNKAIFFKSLYSLCLDKYNSLFQKISSRDLTKFLEQNPQEKEKFFEWFSSSKDILYKVEMLILVYRRIYAMLPKMSILKEYFPDITAEEATAILQMVNKKGL